MVEPLFVHLRVHSDYSMMDGLAKIELLVKRTAELAMPAIAVTDFTNLCGIIKFYNLSHSAGIKPIIGADFYVKNELFNNELTHITILAMNNIGYKNLMLLISKAYKRGYKNFKPYINREWLSEIKYGLLLISGGRMGDIGRCLLDKNEVLLEKCISFYEKNFPDRFYLELTRTGRYNEEIYLQAALTLAEKRNIPIVATNDVRFINIDDFEAHEIRVAIHNGFTLNNPKRPRNYSYQQYMRTEKEMCELFIDIPEALQNSVEIAKRCNVTLCFNKYFLPKFPTNGISTEEFLILKSKEGLKERLNFLFPDKKELDNNRLKYEARLESELKIVNQMGFPSYFLIVMEFVQWSKNNGIPVGPGRGSGAGSLIAYALKITDIDPLKFNLLFERFLNTERISMPDFDIDFCMDKRDLVIDHVSNTYGHDAVSQIITFGTMTAKAVIRDVGRVLGYPYGFINQISKLVPIDPGITLVKALEIETKLTEIYKTDEEVKNIIDIAFKLEGIIRNVSKHAGGVVISPTKIIDFAPLYYDELGQHQLTQFDKNDIEYIGLVKFDFLGLRTLTVINGALEIINKKLKKNNILPININNIPLDDKKSFETLQRSETTAIFQLESNGMKELINRLKPDRFEDLIALIALFRPGPLQSGMVDNFINRKHGIEKISYPDAKWQHKILKSILETTYGIILYQEQVMQIAQTLSGYTLGEADVLRHAMGKKNYIEMVKQRHIFIEGAKKNGINNKLSLKIFNLVEKFAGYGFNKSHSVAYALISYQTLWLKTHYPSEFMSAVMTVDMSNNEKIIEFINECWRMNLKVLPPDINSSFYNFYVNNKGEITYGLGAIKGIGKIHAEEIVKVRNKYGKFSTLFDFCVKIDTKKINRRVLERLIMSGAFDKLNKNRTKLIDSIDKVLKTAHQQIKNYMLGQKDIFDSLTEEEEIQTNNFNSNYQFLSEQSRLDGEMETLGIYLTGHPISQYLNEIKHYNVCCRLKEINNSKLGKVIKIAGLIVSIKFFLTKKRNRFGICILDDMSHRLEIVLFNDIYNKYEQLLKKNNIIIASGKIIFDNFSNKFRMNVSKIEDINEVRKKHTRNISILLRDNQINTDFFNQLNQYLKSNLSGNIPVYLYHQRTDSCVRLFYKDKWYVSLNNRLLNDLRNLVGLEQVKLEFK